ncbi:uncharacterized protein LOC118278793 [Spodoptera frugiperda]|uniref:Uncharacterized protein LOC118278793 n=1 Tax=Spodoptera frugiperda TaxID=7108 RepID=A0A9R0DHT0_SPOFR|nr:uncharacterized protein LOC118278793 [Spodoptera frugiperda]
MEGKHFSPQYPDCNHIARKYVKVEISDDLARQLAAEDNAVYPIYEKKLSDYERMKNNSLQTNELLRCRWKSFVRNIEKRKHEPFIFPNLRDFHFVNNSLQYRPNETITNRPSYRFQMGEGPGVDKFGQIPIPHYIPDNIPTTASKAKHGKKVAKKPTAKK